MKHKDDLILSHQACFPLYALSREITTIYRPLLDALHITYPQYLVLMVLWENEGQTVNQIGERLRLDSGTLTPLLKRMELKKMITRKRKESDERSVEIHLSPSGKALKKEAAKVPAQMVEALGISDEEVNQLKRIANKILDKIKDRGN
ncbi:MAG: MarR family transcriptional regulator [Chitinophagaceae bacterium]|nr:MarR family transcriptional regulator [Chitinophagaceae bacterium]